MLRPETVYTPHIEDNVLLRNTEDRQVWADTFTGLYHVPPDVMPTPKTVLDLGANIGLTAAHYRYLWPDAEIVAVELDADNARMAQINASRVTVRCEAVAAKRGRGAYEASVPSYAYRLGPAGGRGVRTQTLRSIILRSFSLIEDRGGVDFVKMDIEGAEWELFEAPEWAPLVRNLLVELHTENPLKDDDYVVQLGLERLQHAGFVAQRHKAHPRAVFATQRELA